MKGDNYLKNHSLKDNSLLIDNENLLLSNLDIDWDFEDSQRSFIQKFMKIFQDQIIIDINMFFQICILLKTLTSQENTMVNLHLIHTVIIRSIIQMLKSAHK